MSGLPGQRRSHDNKYSFTVSYCVRPKFTGTANHSKAWFECHGFCDSVWGSRHDPRRALGGLRHRGDVSRSEKILVACPSTQVRRQYEHAIPKLGGKLENVVFHILSEGQDLLVTAFLNRVILLGNLTRDPELKPRPAAPAVAAASRRQRPRQRPGPPGVDGGRQLLRRHRLRLPRRALRQYLAKGRQVAIDGRLRWREWETQAARKREAVEVVAETVQFLGPRERGTEPAPPGPRPAAAD